MTVAELIAALQQQDPTAVVGVHNESDWQAEVLPVRLLLPIGEHGYCDDPSVRLVILP